MMMMPFIMIMLVLMAFDAVDCFFYFLAERTKKNSSVTLRISSKWWIMMMMTMMMAMMMTLIMIRLVMMAFDADEKKYRWYAKAGYIHGQI